MDDIKQIAQVCKDARKRSGKYQYQVAMDIGCYTSSTISMFECGNISNAVLLLWYMKHYFDKNDFERLGVVMP